MNVPDELAILLRHQEGLASRSQLLAHGLSVAMVRWRLGRDWRMVLPGVVATFTGRLDARQRLIAAQFYAGPDSVLSSCTAAAWHGIESARTPLIYLQVPGTRSSRRCGPVVVTRTRRPDPHPWSRPPLTISSRPRAVIDAARDLRAQDQADAVVIEAVQRGLVTVEALRHELERAPRQGSRRPRAALDAADTGAWSVPELELGALVDASPVLPESWPNPTLTTPDGRRLPTPDLWLDDVALAVQVHSRRYHDGELWDATVMGDTALGEAGVVVLPVTPNRIAREPDAVLARIERAYLALVSRPRPPVVARPTHRRAS